MVTDIELAQAARLRPIVDVAADLGLGPQDLILRGDHIAKVRLPAVERAKKGKQGRLVLVTGTTPTRFGEGKTLTAVGLAQAFGRLDVKGLLTLREPSLGPVFGVKGGAAGGGRSQVLPMEDINLHFTGDLHAVTAANNLIAAVLDAHLFHGNALSIDARRILFQRCLDMNDRQLRAIVTGLGGPKNGVPREDGFIITAASEVMAILCLAEDMRDLKDRLARIVVGFDRDGKAVRAKDLGVSGAATILLKDALMPNLVQTMEGTPAFVHGGPFANIAHGHNAIVADKLALGMGDVVLTEAGFAADLGGEKFVDLVCRQSGLTLAGSVLVASVRSLKHHGGAKRRDLETEDLKALEKGLPNLDAHIAILRRLGLTPVVAVNRFAKDTDREVAFVVEHCQDAGVRAAPHTVYADGGKGGIELAKVLLDSLKASPGKPRFTYKDADPFEEKVAKVATEIYGAEGVAYDAAALEDLERVRDAGLDGLPVCIAKTQLSLSDDETRRGAPTGWTLRVRGVRPSAGAGFLVVIAGDIMRMPGLGAEPAALGMDIDEDGRIKGLF
ncbi:MAG: formate--tetrahydrofolate ligase [Euryarchaeota archaeon RBG_19FT_COMBO_69_17]|nr:MAG: formate--tetrahydrofolate ligase [Euryarchaeota archaeon RBG_19FT_COMBO_69_17]